MFEILVRLAEVLPAQVTDPLVWFLIVVGAALLICGLALEPDTGPKPLPKLPGGGGGKQGW